MGSQRTNEKYEPKLRISAAKTKILQNNFIKDSQDFASNDSMWSQYASNIVIKIKYFSNKWHLRINKVNETSVNVTNCYIITETKRNLVSAVLIQEIRLPILLN